MNNNNAVLPKRKPIRLKDYDYSSVGSYHITICTKDKKHLFWDNVGARIIQQFKGSVSKQIGFPVWQKGYIDHIIRCQADYDETWQYIDENPLKWILDKDERM